MKMKIIMVEVAIAFHIMDHHQSFSLNDYLNLLLPEVFSNSQTASKYSNTRTKSTAIMKHVMAAFTTTGYQRSNCSTAFLYHKHRDRYSVWKKIFLFACAIFFLWKRLAYKAVVSKIPFRWDFENISKF